MDCKSLRDDRMCRTCMCKEPQMHGISEPINLEEPLSISIREMLTQTVPGLLIKQGDRLPQWICALCRDKLSTSYYFQHMCTTTDKQLHALLAKEAIQRRREAAKQQKDEFFEIKIEVCEGSDGDDADGNEYKIIIMPNDGETENATGDEINVQFVEEEPAASREDNPVVSENVQEKDSTATTVENKGKRKRRKVTEKEVPRVSNMHNETGVGEIEEPNENNRGKNRYPCTKCDKVFDRPSRFKRHMAVHLESNPYQCNICKYRFSQKCLLASHQATTHKYADGEDAPPEGFQCQVCPRRFAKQASLSAHMNCHPKRDRSELYECDQCPEKFMQLTFLNKHLLTHSAQLFKCELCEKSFTMKAHLIEHVNKHNGMKPYVCTHCHKAYQLLSSLKEHLIEHTNSRSHVCPQCGKAFKHVSNLRQHQLRHTTERRYQCTECPKRFICQSDCIKHVKTHAGLKSHTCGVCGVGFGRAYSLKMHMPIHSGERPYKCDECNMTFVFNRILQRHKLTHTGKKPHKCKYCGRAFLSRGDLNKHLRLHIGEKTYQCEQCEEKFKYKAELLAHESKHFKEQQALGSETATIEQPTLSVYAIEIKDELIE